MKKFGYFLATLAVYGLLSINSAMAGKSPDDGLRDQQCPVGLVNGITLDDEFGAGAQDITRCLEKRRNVKILFPLSRECRNDADPCTEPFALGSIQNSIRDYEVTHGMTNGTDFQVVAVAYGSGYKLVLKGNPFEQNMIDLLNKGVTVYLCQNTARSQRIMVQDLIPGVQFVTDCHTSIADLQSLGYRLVAP